MSTDTSEAGFEKHITDYLVHENGYKLRTHQSYDNLRCVDAELLFQFLEETQPNAVEKLRSYHKELYEQRILKRLDDQIKSKGVIEVLRKGITDGHTAVKLDLFYDQPVSNYNVKASSLYQSNCFSVMRQVYYSPANGNSLDMMIFINGIPVISFELKNELTGQTVKDAVKQYREDRSPNEELFRLGRLVVNFAVDSEEVWMCTHLTGENSYFLPFNKGHNHGAGNPPNGGIKTDYLWKEILTKNSLTNIIQNYSQLVKEKKEYLDKNDKRRTKEVQKMIFPRYHQLDAVQRLLKDVKQKGAGQKYLIQHSAGSGKSNSIAWLAHQLSGLHDAEGQELIFDSIIIVTDRRVLDAQIRGTIKQFQQVSGVVEAITEGSKQLKQALEEGKRIIITTIQKFPFIVEEIGDLPGSNFAIIIDEAHSSVSGQMARKLNEVLSKFSSESPEFADLQADFSEFSADYQNEDAEESITAEDYIRILVKSRKLLPNASYFAFTATPKNKTLELFGEPYFEDGKEKYNAFHLYSMKQAIEEGFIKDVLLNYTTYKSYYSLLKKIEDDPEYDKSRAQKKLRHFVESDEHAVRKKTAIMVDHFMESVIKEYKMGGLAKAMVVTSSRANAVRFKKAFDEYLKKINSPYKAIVAFSGEIEGETETQLNGFPSANIPAEFEKKEYRFLIVANKFQTGFDQPLLHTMFVDKKLGGVNAVQTLSRLNRSHPDKKDTFVFDFANTAEEIKKAFEPYYISTILGEGTDPSKLFDLKDALANFQVYSPEQVTEFSDKIIADVSIHEIQGILSRSAGIFHQDLSEEEQIDFRSKVKSYVRLYVFLSQIVDHNDPYLERLFIFLDQLQNKIAGESHGDLAKGILDAINMESYRLQLTGKENIMLDSATDLKPIPTEMVGGAFQPELDKLSNILKTFNERFGTEFGDADKVFKMAENIVEGVSQNEEMINSMLHSDDQNARITSDKIAGEEMLKYISTNFNFYKLINDNQEAKDDFNALIFAMVKKMFHTSRL